MRWDDRPQVKHGDIGERIVDRHLIEAGLLPYRCEVKDRPHPFDRLCATPDKQTIYIADVKTKPARVYYPDTGINAKHYHDYQRIRQKHNIDVFVFFVDYDRAKVYGQYLSELEKERDVEWKGKTLKYPLRQEGIIYFPLSAMITVYELTDADVEELKKTSTRSNSYQGQVVPLIFRLKTAWPTIVKAADRESRVLGALLKGCDGPVRVQKDMVTLAFRYPYHRDKVEAGHIRPMLEALISASMGERCRIQGEYFK